MLREKLQKLQNRAARIMTGTNYDVSSTDLLHAMSWKNLNDRHKMNKSVLMFKILNNHSSAPNLKDKFVTRDINLREASHIDFFHEKRHTFGGGEVWQL